MALSRRTGQRFQASIWPGFVDAMTGLLLVLMFVLTIFMVVQFALRETITGQESELDALSGEVAALARALGLEQDRASALEDRVGTLTATLSDARERQAEQIARIAALSAERDAQAAALGAAEARILSFEEQVAGLLAQRDRALGQVADLQETQEALLTEQETLELALAGLRGEVDAQQEAARLAAAQAAALEALVADLRREAGEVQGALTAEVGRLEEALSAQEAARLAEAAAAEALRARLEGATAELTAMTLALEEERRRAEETLTLLAAAEAAGDDLEVQLAAALVAQQDETARAQTLEAEAAERIAALEAALASLRAQTEQQALSTEEVRAALAAALAAKLAAEAEAALQLSAAEERAALLAQAQAALSTQTTDTEAALREQALLNQQVAALRTQLGELQALLDDAKQREASSDVQLQSLGRDLNTALARVAAEEKRRRELEEERAARLEAENRDLARYRSEFFAALREVLGTQDGVRIEGDRFVFSSEVLFAQGEATLSEEGRGEIAKVAQILRRVAGDIPESVDWVIRVDGHTDNVPIRNSPDFADNWELSQARALSVVRYMINFLGLPPERLAANGFGQYQPVNTADTPQARAQNRRIELKITER